MATRIVGRLDSHEDFTRLGGDMGLTREQIASAAHYLRPGRFPGQVSSGDWCHPFVVNVPLARISPDVTDADVSQRVARLDYLAIVPAEEYAAWPGRPPAVAMKPEEAEDPAQFTAGNNAPQSPTDEEPARISKANLDYLEDVLLRPFLSTTARDKSLERDSSSARAGCPRPRDSTRHPFIKDPADPVGLSCPRSSSRTYSYPHRRQPPTLIPGVVFLPQAPFAAES